MKGVPWLKLVDTNGYTSVYDAGQIAAIVPRVKVYKDAQGKPEGEGIDPDHSNIIVQGHVICVKGSPDMIQVLVTKARLQASGLVEM